VGVHPHDAAKATPETFAAMEALAAEVTAKSKVLAIGEIGLDYHYDFSPRDIQRDVFLTQLKLAGRAGKPIVIHTREAWDDTLALLREHWSGGGIIHCFSGGPVEARQALDLGFHLSFGGVITFPKAEALREAARMVPEDRLLIETDAPYLAPVPKRGKRNEPALIVHTARKLAELRGESYEELCDVTSENFHRLLLLN
jgi:TatD DNase family protein